MNPTLPPLLLADAFAPMDWGVLIGYFVIIVVSGIWLSLRKQNDTTDYFLGGRNMPVWAVVCSIVATALSAATFVGAPQYTYGGDLSYLATHVIISAIIAVVFVGVFFIPAYYKHNVTTVYELLEVRMGRGARQAGSAMFMIGQVFSGGARLFMVAIPASMVLYGEGSAQNMQLAIIVLTAVGICYTLVGGIRSVIWTDVLQLFIFVAAAVTALVLLAYKIPSDIPTVHKALEDAGKLAVETGGSFESSTVTINTASPFTLITALTGLALFNIAAYGTNHDMTQRMLTCRSSIKGSGAAIGSILLSVPVQALFLAVGLGLYVFYQMPDVMGDAKPAYEPNQSHKVFLQFILMEMPPGVKGLFLAGLFAAGLSTLNSGLNSMSSTLVSDFYQQMFRNRSPRHYMIIGRLAMIFWGLVLGGFAIFCVSIYSPENQSLLDFALGVMIIPYAGLLAVFLTAIFTNRGNSFSAIAALFVGMMITLRLEPVVWETVAKNVDPQAVFTVGEVEVPLKVRYEEMAAWCRQIAFPWRMLIATVPAMIICLMGKRREVKREIAPDADFDSKPSLSPLSMKRPI